MMKLILVALSLFSVSVQAADGAANLWMSSFGSGYQIEKDGNVIKGHFQYSNGADFVNLQKKGNSWTGRFGGILVSASNVKCNEMKKCEVALTTMPGSFSNLTVTVKNTGDVEIQGSVNGRLTSASLKVDGNRLTVNGYRASLRLEQSETEGLYEGSISVTGGSNSFSSVELKTAGTLNPAVAEQDPILFSILYVLPFAL